MPCPVPLPAVLVPRNPQGAAGNSAFGLGAPADQHLAWALPPTAKPAAHLCLPRPQITGVLMFLVCGAATVAAVRDIILGGCTPPARSWKQGGCHGVPRGYCIAALGGMAVRRRRCLQRPPAPVRAGTALEPPLPGPSSGCRLDQLQGGNFYISPRLFGAPASAMLPPAPCMPAGVGCGDSTACYHPVLVADFRRLSAAEANQVCVVQAAPLAAWLQGQAMLCCSTSPANQPEQGIALPQPHLPNSTSPAALMFPAYPPGGHHVALTLHHSVALPFLHAPPALPTSRLPCPCLCWCIKTPPAAACDCYMGRCAM